MIRVNSAISRPGKSNPSVCFFTICGGGEDYDFLLGSIEHHAKMGKHVVLDTAPSGTAKRFKGLPSSVTWVYEPIYGHGWHEFRFRSALARSLELAKAQGADVVVQLDTDEYFSDDSPGSLFPFASENMVSVETLHWREDKPYSFGPGEHHVRLWPSRMDVRWPVNEGWIRSPHYNGNPDHHAVVVGPPGTKIIRVEGHYHYHLHYFVGEKMKMEETAKQTIHGWPNGNPARISPLPFPIWIWKFKGHRPSGMEKFKA